MARLRLRMSLRATPRGPWVPLNCWPFSGLHWGECWLWWWEYDDGTYPQGPYETLAEAMEERPDDD